MTEKGGGAAGTGGQEERTTEGGCCRGLEDRCRLMDLLGYRGKKGGVREGSKGGRARDRQW